LFKVLADNLVAHNKEITLRTYVLCVYNPANCHVRRNFYEQNVCSASRTSIYNIRRVALVYESGANTSSILMRKLYDRKIHISVATRKFQKPYEERRRVIHVTNNQTYRAQYTLRKIVRYDAFDGK